MSIYVVNAGDTVDSIAASYGVSPEQLIWANQLTYPYELAVGQALLIQDGAGQAGRRIVSGGYAYPFISPWVLRQTLPYLTKLYVFSYGFAENGELIYPFWDDRWMIEEAVSFGARPILVLTPFGADGMFNNLLINRMVSSGEAQEYLIGNILSVMKEKGFQGLDIDFEYILASDREKFTEFVRRCSEAMHENGFTLSVALAPKTSADQPGLLYEGKDYRALGEAADSVLLMTYEWGYKYGPPMAVAPLNKVRQVVEYAVTEIPPEKIGLGVPNYGYDWPLPFIQETTRARTIGNIEAVRIAIDNGAPIRFDETASSPYFEYTADDGVSHVVWYEDVRSLQAKFGLIEEFGLKGPGYWQIMQLFRANWLLLSDTFQIIKG